jgi:hypothetical protein
MTVLNVLGTDLVPCSYDPLTGFYRDGCCQTDELDHGTHVVCARMNALVMKTRITELFGIAAPVIIAGRHALASLNCRLCRTGGRGVQRRRSGHDHRPDPEDARAAGQVKSPVPGHDRQAVRREPHLPAHVRQAAVPRNTSARSSKAA